MGQNLITSILACGCLFIANLITRTKHNWLTYFWLFVVIFVFKTILYSSLFGNENLYYKERFENDYRNYLNIREYIMTQDVSYGYKLSDSERRKYEDLIEDHLEKAYDHYVQAKNKCMWLPNMADRVKADHCFTTALMTLSATNPMSKVVMAIATMANIYGLSVINEWREINTHLNYSKYYYEQQEFYTNVLNQYK